MELPGNPLHGLVYCCFFPGSLHSISTSKGIALVTALCGIAALIFRHKQVAARLSVPFLDLSLWVIMNGISALYVTSGKFAPRAFVVVLTSFCCLLLLLAFTKGDKPPFGPGLCHRAGGGDSPSPVW